MMSGESIPEEDWYLQRLGKPKRQVLNWEAAQVKNVLGRGDEKELEKGGKVGPI